MPGFLFFLNRARLLRRSRLLVFALGASLAVAGCHRVMPTNTIPLDGVGLSFSTIQSLKSLGITDAEVAEIVTAKQGGLSDDGCVTLVRLAHSRNEKFHIGDDVTQLLRAGVAESTIIELAKLNQIGLWTGEAQAMRLAGLSDEIILEAAHRRAEGKPVLSGASLANFKNAGMREGTLLQLVRRGVADDEAQEIIRLRRRGWSDAQILRRYPGR
ncbi:MAG TPA: hypothetical protein VGU63_11460 [Candidatus Acidoferrales bacterium]|nr:hypothetical protein [Candidatus Acidoferrales bacterium]